VLDCYHRAEHLYTVAKAQFDNPPDVEQWVEAASAWLSLDQSGLIISWSHDMKSANVRSKEEIRKSLSYLDHNHEYFGYAKRRAEGPHIGSGRIESTNKYISTAQLNCSGTEWLLIPKGNNVLRLRCALYNDTCARIIAQQRTKGSPPRAAASEPTPLGSVYSLGGSKSPMTPASGTLARREQINKQMLEVGCGSEPPVRRATTSARSCGETHR